MAVVERLLSKREPGRNGLARIRKADREALYALEDWAGDVNTEQVMDPEGNKELAAFASAVFRTLHWVRAIDCRKNHPDWEPGHMTDMVEEG